MKLATFSADGVVTWGVVQSDEIIDVGSVLRHRFEDLKAFIAEGDLQIASDAVSSARVFAISSVTWLPVIMNPQKIICAGHNYPPNDAEADNRNAAGPHFFARFANSQTGHLSAMVRPRNSDQFDYEGELAVIIGEPGRLIPRSRAMSHVAGFACYNEGSVRDFQRHSSQFTPGKNFPFTGAFGPWMVTRDEISDLNRLRLQTRVNGELVQETVLGRMVFDVPRLIEYCSSFTRLESGDVLVTGTPDGIGSKRQPPSWLEPGDVVEVEIESIGLLRNTVVQEGALKTEHPTS